MCGWQIQLCLFTFRPIALKQLNSLTTIYTFSWLDNPEIKHMQELPGSIPGSSKGFYVLFSILLLLCFNFLVQNTFLSRNFIIPFVSYFPYDNMLKT